MCATTWRLWGLSARNSTAFVGYYGEQLMLLAQSLGLNSCWVGGTYKVVNRAYNVDLGQKLAAVIALGYGATQGVPHRSKAPQAVAPGYDGAPEWFKRGVDAALLAPTALNQQKFSFCAGRSKWATCRWCARPPGAVPLPRWISASPSATSRSVPAQPSTAGRNNRLEEPREPLSWLPLRSP